jgi:glycerophosphoryl diester phosphodiesterase
VDEAQVRQVHDASVRVVPWTVNDPAVLARLLDWMVDSVTTGYPDMLAAVLCWRG